jgi:hypothetical protein
MCRMKIPPPLLRLAHHIVSDGEREQGDAILGAPERRVFAPRL